MTRQRQERQDSIDTKMKASAERAFELLQETPGAADAAKANRATIYAWLLRVDSVYREASALVTDEVAEQFKVAVDEATCIGAANPYKNALQRLFGMLFSGGQLLSRQNENHPWEATGFHWDAAVKTAYAKVGKALYQPIGFDDGTHYVPSDGSKLLWMREFALSVMVPFKPAFQPVRQAGDADEATEVRLTPQQLIGYKEMIDYFEQDLMVIGNPGRLPVTGKQAPGMVGKKIVTARAAEMGEPAVVMAEGCSPLKLDGQFWAPVVKVGDVVSEDTVLVEWNGEASKEDVLSKLPDTIKLARIRCDALDVRLKKLEDEHGADVVSFDLVKMATACKEFLALKVAEHTVRDSVVNTSLVGSAPEQAQKDVVRAAIKTLEGCLADGKLKVDGDTAAAALAQVFAALPVTRLVTDQMTPDTAIETAIAAVLTHVRTLA